MPLKKRVLLKNMKWALALLDSTAEVTIVRRTLLEHLEVKATDDFLQVETADMRVSMPDRVYKVTLQLEGDIERIIVAIFWDRVVNIYDVLSAEQDWPPEFFSTFPYGEDGIKHSFSPLFQEELAESYAIDWALAQATALYRNHVGWDKESPYHVIPIKYEPQPQPQYPIKHEAKAPVREILTQLEYQGVIEPCVSPMNNPLFQYELEYPVPANTLPIEQYHRIMYTDGSAQPAIGTKHQYSSACAVVNGYMEDNTFCPLQTFTQTLEDCTAQLAELKALLMVLEHTDPAQWTLIVCDSYYCVQSFNEYLHYWRQNGFRDSKGNTIKHRLLWGKVADLKETLPNVHVVHTLGHQCIGIHVAGNTLADKAAKSAVATASVAAVARFSMKPDADIWAAVKATADGTPYPKTFPAKCSYRMGGRLNAEGKIPGVGVQDIPNKDIRPELIKAAHEEVASAHAGISMGVATTLG
ncbi:hypothetical protein NDU88_006177 [Pleurodeles waltl]|uniref:ribonuclease H n=1 Tax=Pleurodeles waltl TaxID=8319 RepID=A0AAV7W9V2_PLEWA|nr:hypothetical protein NDU88_006177 [Pleurodeles waltl]